MTPPPHRFGPDYPRFFEDANGAQIPLDRERRWSRTYRDPASNVVHQISRFMDGSATISLADLRAEWPGWRRSERMDFCTNVAWLQAHPDLADMLRFVFLVGDADDCSAVALSAATHLPPDEAFQLLSERLPATEPAHCSNLLQAIARTKHPSAAATIRQRLEQISVLPDLWLDDPFLNWFAYTATCAVRYLIDLGTDPLEFHSIVRALAQHTCSRCRDSCRRTLKTHYPWLSSVGRDGDGPG